MPEKKAKPATTKKTSPTKAGTKASLKTTVKIAKPAQTKTKPVAKVKTETVKAGKPAAKTKAAVKAIDETERQRRIAETAYYLAERRGFAAGDPAGDWIEAERIVDAQLRR